MKVTKLTVQNIGIIADAVVEINKPEIVFYGDIKQGKSTLLNAVRWVCGGHGTGDGDRCGHAGGAGVVVDRTERTGET